MPALALLAGIGGAVLARGLGTLSGAFGVANDLFGSFVAVTGDAHQAQVAQDIFRADILHELSLLIREDMRDVYALMCETVNTQVTMGSIVLGACFTVLIEGYFDGDAPAWVIELWAMMVSWAVMFTFSSLLLAMYFQTSIGTRVRERLLVTHRIFTPNDSVISSLGGYSLAEQVARLHSRLVAQLVTITSLLASGGGAGEARTGAGAEARERERLCAAEAVEAEEQRQVLQPEVTLPGPTQQYALTRARLGVQAWFEEEATEVPAHAVDAQQPAAASAAAPSAAAAAAAKQGSAPRQLSPRKIVELPNFLVGGTLVRQPWVTQCCEPLRLFVHDEATLYLAGRPLPAEGGEESASPPQSRRSLTQALELDRVRRAWDDMPAPTRGNHQDNQGFQRVEGFSVYVDSHKIHLPLYKLALRTPEAGRPVEVEVAWNFQQAVEALIVVVREGCVLGSEDEFPKQAFMQEIEVLRPHLIFSGRFMQCGTTCLLLAVAFLHLARMLVVRPWPACAGETLAVASAVLVALTGTWLRVPLARAEAGSEALWAPPRRNSQSFAQQTCGGAAAGPVTGLGNPLVSSKLFHQRNRNWRTLAACSAGLGAIFITSLISCLLGIVLDSAAELAPASPALVTASSRWADWPLEWPALAAPSAAALLPRGRRLWAASGWLLVALDAAADGQLRPSQAPWRLPNLTVGLCSLGDKLLVASEDGLLRILSAPAADPSGSGPAAPAGSVLAALATELAPAQGVPSRLPPELTEPLAALAAAPAPAPNATFLALAPSAPGAGVLLCEASGLGGPAARIEVLARMRLPESTAVAALFLCTEGPCAASGARIWAADSAGELIQASLDAGDFAPASRPFSGGLGVAALAGNQTHLVAISAADGSARPPGVRTARFDALLRGAGPEL